MAKSLLLLLALAASAVVYYPLTRAYFFADDFVCMLDIVNHGVLRFLVQPFGEHLLIIRNAVFSLSYRLFGLDPRPYYWGVLLTHLLNVWLLFRVASRFTGRLTLACLGAALWGTSPLCVGALGWYSVYGHVLVGTILVVLLDRISACSTPVSTSTVLGWYALLLAGACCFGVGIGVALIFPLVLFLLRPEVFAERRIRLTVLSLLVVVPALYFGVRRLYFLFTPMPLQEAFMVNATFRRYLPIVSMLWHLIAFAITGLVSGFFLVPETYPGPAAHIIVTLCLVGLLAAFFSGHGPTRRRLAALASLSLATYALVSLGRANVNQMFKVDTWVTARMLRYHYAGTIPLALMIVVLLDRATRRQPALVPAVILGIWFAVATYAFARSPWRIDEFFLVRQWVASALQRIDRDVAGRPAGQDAYVENEPAPGYVLGPMIHSPEFPGLAGIFVLAYPANVLRGRRVYFIERNAAVLEMFRAPATNRRLAGLLVGPNEAPGGEATLTRQHGVSEGLPNR